MACDSGLEQAFEACQVLAVGPAHRGYPELTAVLAAAVLGLSVQPPLAWLASHQGINILLAILVFATAVTIESAAPRSLTRTWLSLLTALAAGIPVLPALSWAVSQIVAAGPLRDGIMTFGLAPGM